MNRQSWLSNIALIFILVISICGAIMTYVTVPQGDDAVGYLQSKEFLDSLAMEYTTPDIVGTIIDGWHNTNGRISTPLTRLLLIMLPSWVIAILNGAFILGLLSLIYHIAKFPVSYPGGKTTFPAVLLLIGILSLAALPWHDTMFLMLFSSTYLWHAVLLLLCTIVFLKLMLPKGEVTYSSFVLLIPFIVLAGNWQEGSSLCLLGPLCVMSLFVPRKNLLKYLILLSSLGIGILSNVISPGLSSRAESMPIGVNPFNWFQPKTLTGGIWLWPHDIIPVIFLVSISVILILNYNNLKNIYRQRACGIGKLRTLSGWVKTEILCILVTGTNLALGLFFCLPRVSFIGNVFSIIGISILSIICIYRNGSYPFKHFPHFSNSKSRITIRVLLLSSSLVLSVNMVTHIFIQKQITEDHKNVIRLLTDSPDGTVFYDGVHFPHYPHCPWQWSINSFYVDQYSLHSMLNHPKISNPLRLIPTALQDIPDTEAIYGPKLYRSHIISANEPAMPTGQPRTEIFPGEYPFLKINAIVETASGRETIRFFEVIPFTTSKGTAHQRDLYYFRPIWRSWSDIEDPAVKILSVSPAKYW